MQLETKVCTKCKREKSTDEFYKDRNKSDGRMSECITCRKEYFKTRNFPIDTTKKTKICRKCEKEKPIKEFSRDKASSDGLYCWCKYCKQKRWKERYSKKQYYLKNRYNLTPTEYSQMLDRQGGKCFICGRTEDENGKALNVDHNHKTEVVRDLLCTRCNFIVGIFEENFDLCQRILEYINQHGKE